MLAESLLQDVLVTANARNEDVLRRAFGEAERPKPSCRDDYECKCSPHWNGPHSGLIHDLLTVQPMTGGDLRIQFGSINSFNGKIVYGHTHETCDLHHRIDCPTCA